MHGKAFIQVRVFKCIIINSINFLFILSDINIFTGVN